MAFSLLNDAWIPARRAQGTLEMIRPSDITSAIDDDPIVALDWPRPDFRLAGLEFLIGLLATSCPPADNDDGWIDWWQRPPAPDALQEAFLPFSTAFMLDGEGPRFMQDLEAIPGEPNPVETLLIDAPGGQTRKKNADHFVKRDSTAVLGRPAAAMALFTLQAFAPAGGAGNRVGLRGGGPLTTLAMPPWHGVLPLWHLLWANVPVGLVPAASEMPRIFPWLAATRTSEGARITTPSDVHGLQAFWGAARRIRLAFEDNALSAPCDLIGSVDSVVVRGWTQRPYGANYARWQHPLSPYYRQKASDTEWLPVHAQPGGVGYRHWVGLLVTDAEDQPTRRAAGAIDTFRNHRLAHLRGADRVRWRMLAAGFDMDNMKARGFVESEMPIVEPAIASQTPDFIILLRDLINSATEVTGLLGRAVRRALFSEGAKVALDAALFATLRARFWDLTESEFYRRVQDAADADPDLQSVRRAWLGDLADAARHLFAESAPMDTRGADRRPDRIASAARSLNLALRGYSKDGEALWRTLRLPPLEKSSSRRPAAASPKPRKPK